jgi:hypothetical protein
MLLILANFVLSGMLLINSIMSLWASYKAKREAENNVKIIGACFDCKEPHDITGHRFGQEVFCKQCGGFVVTKTGKASITVEPATEK